MVILGETGSGKSLLAQALMGTLPPELTARGRVAVAGRVLDTGSPDRFRGLWGREIGVLPQVARMRQQSSQVEANALTVRLELMADCFSGIWASNVEGLMEKGDLQEALNAARMIGDDHLQRQAGQVPQPHTFTHGTSAQRARWFERGFESGEIAACDTFEADRL